MINKKQKNFETVPPQLLPIRCHFSQDSLLTSNCDIFKIIEITQYILEDGTNNVRNILRKALMENVKCSNISANIYIVRQRENITSATKCNIDTLNELQDKWNRSLSLHKALNNRLYIAFTSSSSRKLLSEKNILSRALLRFYKKAVQNSLNSSYKELSATIDSFCNSIPQLKPRVLTIRKNSENKYISEPASLISELFRVSADQIPLQFHDIAPQLSEGLNASYNTASITFNNGEEEYTMAVFSIKNIMHINIADVDKILSLDFDLSITESIRYIPKNIAAKEWLEHYTLAKGAKSSELIKFGKLDTLTNEPDAENTYCYNQISIVLKANSAAELKERANKLLKITNDAGLQIIREDVGSPGTLLSQIPGNSQYRRRELPNATRYACSFASPLAQSSGNNAGSSWGSPIVTFNNLMNNIPYYFNFHTYNTDSPLHSVVLSSSENSTSSAHFAEFISMMAATKNINVICLDYDNSFKRIAHLMQINHDKFGQPDGIQHNICNLLDEQNDALFLPILSALIGADLHQDHQSKEYIDKMISSLQTKYDNCDELFDAMRATMLEIDPNTDTSMTVAIQKLRSFLDNDTNKELFGTNNTTKISEASINNKNLYINHSHIDNKKMQNASFVLSLMEAVEQISQTDNKVVLLINSMETILNDSGLSEIAYSIFKKLKNNNCAIVCSVNDISAFYKLESPETFIEFFTNRFYLNRRYLTRKQGKALLLKDKDVKTIRSYSKFKKSFTLKKRNETMVCSINDFIASMDNNSSIMESPSQ